MATPHPAPTITEKGEQAESGGGESPTAALQETAPAAPPVQLIVGIGASAGGLNAFKTFFGNIRADTGMIFVLIQHLDPNVESQLPSIIRGYTEMDVQVATEGTIVRPNTVYVIPPDAVLTIRDGALRLVQPAVVLARRNSVNSFLISLAQDQNENAVGIILSGFGSDGAEGIAAIKEHGGLTLSEAEFDHHAKSGMPQSATAAGFVDHVLPVQDMPEALLNYQHHRTIFAASVNEDGIRTDLEGSVPIICAALKARTGRDFSNYKLGTLMRRIQRRMHVLQSDDVADYIDQLRTMPHEADALFREFLVSVTGFFRDPAAFAALDEKILRPALADGEATTVLRIWVAGCATGEEAYSIAILLLEGMNQTGHQRRLQIFATDIDDRAVDVARAGLYPASALSSVSDERVTKHFVKEGDFYRVTKNLREMCLFSTHDLVKDPPFSRLDLVSCRNLLIYFQPPLQDHVLTLFHYALRPGGHLFLGQSENVPAQSRLFVAIDKKNHFYARRDATPRFPAFLLGPTRPPTGVATGRRSAQTPGDDLDRRAARAMARYNPAFLVVDRQNEILRFSGQTADYIEPATGAATLNLFTLLHADLRQPVRTALAQCGASGQRTVFENVHLKISDSYHAINLIVEPLTELPESGHYLIAFQEVIQSKPDIVTITAEQGQTLDAAALDKVLQVTREQLRHVSEELETVTEELQSSNQEYLAVNEELQSANEELETSKEELQSLNEELQTTNAELNHRNENLMRSNSDLANLFDSTAIATLFLDNDLRIRRFTPRVLDIFNLREGDEGRPISDIVTHLTRDGLPKDMHLVLRTLTPIEREVEATTGLSYLMQIRPYRDLNNTVNGVVISFVDISERKQHEQARSRLAAIVESSQDGIISHDLGGAITSWNTGAEQLFGYTATEAIGNNMTQLLKSAELAGFPDMLARMGQGEHLARFDIMAIGKSGRAVEVSITISPVREGEDRIVGASVIARDISERNAADRRAALLLGELDHRVKNILAIVSAVVSQTLALKLPQAEFATEVDGRIKAIANAHSLLTQTGHGTVSLRDVIDTELAPYRRAKGAIVITGSAVDLAPRAGMALAMAIHELTSNAVKYGALASPAGRLTVNWSTDSDAMLTFVWTETGGPVVKVPTRRGFGTTLIERALEYELDAIVVREFLPIGVQCTIKVPLTQDISHTPLATEA